MQVHFRDGYAQTGVRAVVLSQEVSDQTCRVIQLQHIDTGPTSLNTDPIRPGPEHGVTRIRSLKSMVLYHQVKLDSSGKAGYAQTGVRAVVLSRKASDQTCSVIQLQHTDTRANQS